MTPPSSFWRPSRVEMAVLDVTVVERLRGDLPLGGEAFLGVVLSGEHPSEIGDLLLVLVPLVVPDALALCERRELGDHVDPRVVLGASANPGRDACGCHRNSDQDEEDALVHRRARKPSLLPRLRQGDGPSRSSGAGGVVAEQAHRLQALGERARRVEGAPELLASAVIGARGKVHAAEMKADRRLVRGMLHRELEQRSRQVVSAGLVLHPSERVEQLGVRRAVAGEKGQRLEELPVEGGFRREARRIASR
jgi:hypothetical protein